MRAHPSFTFAAVALSALFAFSASVHAQPADHGHDHDHDESELGHRGQHAHPRHPHFTHPLVTESPVPETQVRFGGEYARADEDGADAHAATAEVSFEYAVTPNFGLELAVPYSYVEVEGEGSQDRLDNVEVAFKFADYRFGERGVLLGAGVELGLPTGDAGAGIGSDRTVEVEPYLAVAAQRGDFEAIGVLRFGVPVNEPSEEAGEVDLEMGLDVSLLYHLTPRVAAILEFNGEAVVAGDADESGLMLSPGVSVAPFAGQEFRVGVGAGVPLDDDPEADYELRLMAIWHL